MITAATKIYLSCTEIRDRGFIRLVHYFFVEVTKKASVLVCLYGRACRKKLSIVVAKVWGYVSVEMRPLPGPLSVPRSCMSGYGAAVEYCQGRLVRLGEKPVPVTLLPPQIPHGLSWVRTRASAVRSRRLTAWEEVAFSGFFFLIKWTRWGSLLHTIMSRNVFKNNCTNNNSNNNYWSVVERMFKRCQLLALNEQFVLHTREQIPVSVTNFYTMCEALICNATSRWRCL
jgi:hypothetical protein